MAAKILKYAALPAAVVGLGSIRIYSVNEKRNEELITPKELSIYSPDGPAVQFVEEQPGVVQTGLGAVRVGLQPYVRAVQSAFTSGKLGMISVYQATQDTYHFLRDPPPGFLPRVGVIGVSGLSGLILARKGSRLKRIAVPLGLATAGTAVCYPTQTVAVLKITGKKVYTVSSSVASMLKSKPKEDVIKPDVSVESAAADTALPKLSPESAPPPAVLVEKATPISEAESVEFPSVADIVSGDAVEPPSVVDLTTGTLETLPVTETTPEPVDGAVQDAESTLEPVAETVIESTPEPSLPEPVVDSVPEAALADCVEDAAPEQTPSAETDVTPLVEADPEIFPNAATASPEFELPAPTVVLEEATPSTTPTVEETNAPAPILPEDATAATVDEEPASVSQPTAEEAIPLTPPPAEEAIPLTPPPAEEAPPSSQPVVEPATVKSRFVPDPSLLDHGQSNPEDADLYSTRS